MRHRNAGKGFGRRTAHRIAMLKNLVVSLIHKEAIRTTLPKAKELRRVAERLITLAKEDSLAKRRLAYSRIGHEYSVDKLFKEIGPRFKTRPGGYTRILKCGFRAGDKAPMALISLVDKAVKKPSDQLISTEKN